MRWRTCVDERWFAWHPVYLSDIQTWVWLETVQRERYSYKYSWSYSLLEKS